MKRLSLALLVLLLVSGCAAREREAAPPESPAQSAQPAEQPQAAGGEENAEEAGEARIAVPDFEMTMLSDETASLSDFQGKKVLLNFWATWCGPCVGEMPAFQRLSEEYPDELVILAVNCGEDEKTVRRFAEDNGYTFPIVLDADGVIQALFGGVTSLPATVILDEEGYAVTARTGAADADTMYELYKTELNIEETSG